MNALDALKPKTKEFASLLMRHKTLMVITIIINTIIAMITFKYTDKTFKVNSIVSIPTQYFQIPLVADFVPTTYDGQELRAQREVLMRGALNFDYLYKLGRKYNLFEKVAPEDVTTYELQLLSKQFEIVPLGAASFLVSFSYKNPNVAYEVLREVIQHLKDHLQVGRMETLEKVRSAVQDRLEAMSFGKGDAQVNETVLASRPDLVKQEVQRVQEEINVLKGSYSDKHPRVAALNKRLNDLSKWLQPEGGNEKPKSAPKNFSGANVDPSSQELFQELLRKYHYLEVVLLLDRQNHIGELAVMQEPYVPKAALWPKRPIFIIWGVANGFIIGSLLALAVEALRARVRREDGPRWLIARLGFLR